MRFVDDVCQLIACFFCEQVFCFCNRKPNIVAKHPSFICCICAFVLPPLSIKSDCCALFCREFFNLLLVGVCCARAVCFRVPPCKFIRCAREYVAFQSGRFVVNKLLRGHFSCATVSLKFNVVRVSCKKCDVCSLNPNLFPTFSCFF